MSTPTTTGTVTKQGTNGAASPAARPSLLGRSGSLTRLVVPPVIVFVLFLGFWSLIAVTVYAGKSYLLPPPWGVAEAAWTNRAELLGATWLTFEESITGFALAIVIGVVGATIMSQAKMLERSFYPYAVLLQTVPVVAVAPVIVLWFGYNQNAVIVISFMISLFPILNNTLLGLLSADRNQLDLFRLHRANRAQQFVKLRLPGALPNIFAGLRISAGLSVIGAIVGEFIIGSGGTEGGLGVKVIFDQSKLDTNMLFADVLAATVLGFGFFLAVSIVSNLLLRSWHESALKSET